MSSEAVWFLHIFGVNVLEQKFLAYFHVNFKSQSSQSARNHPLSEEAVKYPVDKRPMISVSFLINEPLLKLISLEVIHLFCHLSFIHFLCCCSLLLNLDSGCLRVKGKHPAIFKNPLRVLHRQVQMENFLFLLKDGYFCFVNFNLVISSSKSPFLLVVKTFSMKGQRKDKYSSFISI